MHTRAPLIDLVPHRLRKFLRTVGAVPPASS
jgi:hypothetical protein